MIAHLSIAATIAAAGVPSSPVTLGLFAPYAPFASPLERAKFAEDLAKAVGGSATEVRGEAYSKSSDLLRDLTSGRIQIGFVNPQLLAVPGKNVDLRPLLVGSTSGSPMCPYALYVATRSRARNLSHLKKKRLAIVRTGSSETQFIFNAVLRGELRSVDYFRKIVLVPDLAGAVGILRFRKADAFIGPDLDYGRRFKGRRLRKLARVGESLCALMVVDGSLSEAARDRLARLVRGALGRVEPLLEELGLDGLTEVPSGALKTLKSAVRSDVAGYARATPMFLMPPEPKEEKLLKVIKETKSASLPDPTLFVIERDGL